MAAISLDTAQARETARTFANCASSFGSELQSLRSSAQATEATWQGPSKGQFEGLWSDWCSKLQNLIQELESLSSGLNREADEFDQAAQSFSS